MADFKVAEYKVAIMRPQSQVQTLKSYGLEAGDAFLVKDGVYTFADDRVIPIPPADAYASPQAFGKAIVEWAKAVEAFDQADQIIGRNTPPRQRTWKVVIGKDDAGVPLTPMAFLKGVFERGLSLAHQAEMGEEQRKKAEAAAKAAGRTEKPSANGKAKRSKVVEEY